MDGAPLWNGDVIAAIFGFPKMAASIQMQKQSLMLLWRNGGMAKRRPKTINLLRPHARPDRTLPGAACFQATQGRGLGIRDQMGWVPACNPCGADEGQREQLSRMFSML
jgi:hypothetical protein